MGEGIEAAPLGGAVRLDLVLATKEGCRSIDMKSSLGGVGGGASLRRGEGLRGEGAGLFTDALGRCTTCRNLFRRRGA